MPTTKNTPAKTALHCVEDYKKWSRHGTNDCQTHQEMRDALLYHRNCSDHRSANLGAFSFFGRDDVEVGLVYRERVGMYRRLDTVSIVCPSAASGKIG
jgi:hypothetical protein